MSDEPKGRIYEAVCAMLAETEAIGKNRKNVQQGYVFRGIDDVYNTVHRLLAKHKVFSVSRIIGMDREERTTPKGAVLIYTRLQMEYTFFADDGSSITTQVVGEGMDSGDKSSNKAMSIAYKYALFQLLCIPTEAIDPDAETPPPINGKARQQPKQQQPPDPVTVAIKTIRDAKTIERIEQLDKAVDSRAESGDWTVEQVGQVKNEITLRRRELKAEQVEA